jgi:hypothetical protein
VQERGLWLQALVDAFSVKASTFFPANTDVTDAVCSDAESEQFDSDSAANEFADGETLQPETVELLLPSSLGPAWCSLVENEKIVKQEISLRIGQANDALHHLRISLTEKSFLFRNQIRKARSQQKKTRAWDSFHSLEGNVRHHVRVYGKARGALVRLSADVEVLSKYRILKKEDIKVSTAVIDPRKPSQAEATLAWF